MRAQEAKIEAGEQYKLPSGRVVLVAELPAKGGEVAYCRYLSADGTPHSAWESRNCVTLRLDWLRAHARRLW